MSREQRGPVRLATTVDEKSAAHLNDAVEHGTQTDPVIRTDALATSSIIYSALNGIPDRDADPTTRNMKKIAQRLSKNSLSSWYKGAVLLCGTPSEIERVYGPSFADANCFDAEDNMLPWLTELRRAYGNDWTGCMKAARMIEEYQSSKMRDEQWSKLPAVSAFERENGNVRGWDFINSTSEDAL